MEIKKLKLQGKKGATIGINKMVGIVLVILVVVLALVFLFRSNIVKWLGFIPDYKTEEESRPCDVLDSCQVINEKCFCKTNAGDYSTCEQGEYCYPAEGCFEQELIVYAGKDECKMKI